MQSLSRVGRIHNRFTRDMFFHIYRESNSVINKITNLTFNFIDLIWWHVDSDVVFYELVRDMLEFPFYRFVP